MQVVLFTFGGYTVFEPNNTAALGPPTTVFLAHTDNNNHFVPVLIEPSPAVDDAAAAAVQADDRILLDRELRFRLDLAQPQPELENEADLIDDNDKHIGLDDLLDANLEDHQVHFDFDELFDDNDKHIGLDDPLDAILEDHQVHFDFDELFAPFEEEPGSPVTDIGGQDTQTAVQAGHVVAGAVGPALMRDAGRLTELVSGLTYAIQADRLVSQHGQFFDGARGRLGLGGQASAAGSAVRAELEQWLRGMYNAAGVPGEPPIISSLWSPA